MRSSSIMLVAAAAMLACADSPQSLLEPGDASFNVSKAPPPWALIEGDLTTDGSGAVLTRVSFSRTAADGGATMSHNLPGAATYRAWLLVTPGNQAALLRFAEGGTNVSFSKGAMITKVNGKVSGRGTMTVSGHTYELSAVTDFDANGECAGVPFDEDGPSCASFSAGDGSFSSQGSVWTGILSNDGGGRDFDFPPGWDGCQREDCFCINCVDTNVGGKGKRR